MIIGPVDKNIGESSIVCPSLYYKALEGMYSKEAGYEDVIPPKCTSYMIKKWGSNISKYVISTEEGKQNQKGDEVQIMLGWKHTYKKKGWNKYATFDTKGRPNIVYGLFKLKNLLDPETRKKKWFKLYDQSHQIQNTR